MKRLTYPVYVDKATADRLKLVDAEGRPTDYKGEGVYVGETEPTTTYESWDDVPPEARATLLNNANRQAIQDSKNALRADIKTGSSLTLTKQRDQMMLAPPSDPAEIVVWAKEIQRLGQEIADAKATKKLQG